MQFLMPCWWRAYRERRALVAAAAVRAETEAAIVSESPGDVRPTDDILARFLERHTADVIDLATWRSHRRATPERAEEATVQAAAATADSVRLEESLSR